eukprot:6470026-Prymnesium_polylepis.1
MWLQLARVASCTNRLGSSGGSLAIGRAQMGSWRPLGGRKWGGEKTAAKLASCRGSAGASCTSTAPL